MSSSSAVGDDGTIYVGAYDGMLYAVNPDGSQKWTYKAGEGLDSSPAIGSDGTVYITSWGIPEIDIPEELEGMPGFEDTEGEFGKLHAINSSSKGLADSPWPMFRHDAKHTGRTDLCIRAVIHTVEKGPIEAVWKEGGRDDTDAGDRVIWGHFYADPTDVDWGSEENPDLFVKIWFDRNGRLDVNFFHVSVPDIEVFSEYKGTSQQGRTTLTVRYIRQWYLGDEKGMETREEDGVAATGYSQTGNPSGYSTINGLKIGTSINIENAGLIDAMWRKGGGEITADGHEVLWGHFYADPSVVGWGSENNPDLFVKIWFDAGGRIDVNFFHVSVPEIEVYSEYPEGDGYDETGTAIMADRYLRHEYWR